MTLAPRLHGQPQKTIEASLAEWADATGKEPKRLA